MRQTPNTSDDEIAAPTDLGPADPWGKWLRGWGKPLAVRTLAPLRWTFGRWHESAFGILMYHRVTPRVPGVPEPTWNVTPRRFASQLNGLLAGGYEPWPLTRVLDHHESGEPIPRRVFVVTFDDGYANNFTAALPILRKLTVPATIFVATAYLDSPAPFPSDDWAAAGSPDVPVESWRPLTAAECTRLAADPLIEVAAHTHTHDDFRGRPDDLEADLRTNMAVLRDRFGIERPTFAFPYGTKSLGFAGGELTEAARRAGVRCSLTTERRLVLPGSDPFDWGRFTVYQHDTATTIAVRLDGWLDWARRVAGRSTDDVNGGGVRVGERCAVPRHCSMAAATSESESAAEPMARPSSSGTIPRIGREMSR